MKRRTDCPGCGGSLLPAGLLLRRQPVVLNYRFRSVAEAQAVPRRDVDLRRGPAHVLPHARIPARRQGEGAA
jgi:hypothetical protein